MAPAQNTISLALVLFSYDMNQLPAEAKYLLLAALGMFVLSILFMLMLYLRRWWMIIRDKKKADLRFSYQYFIYDALVGKRGNEAMPSVELIIGRFRQEKMKAPLQKQVMIDLLIELKKSFSGESARQFARLYTGLGLEQYSIAKLKRKDAISRIQGLRELSELNHSCPHLEEAISKWQFSEVKHLADEARLAAVRAGSPQMFQFLDKLRRPVDEWLKIQLHHLLNIMPEAERPRLDQWLRDDNPYALLLALELITLTRQEISVEQVIPLLHHQDDAIKEKTLDLLLVFEMKHACSAIFHLLDTDNKRLQIAALHAIGKLGNRYHAELLGPLLQRKSAKISDAAHQAISSIEQRKDAGVEFSRTNHINTE